jgi:ATP-dependent DNA ligase
MPKSSKKIWYNKMTTISELRNIIEYTRSLNSRDEKLSYLYTQDRDVHFLAGNIRKDGIAKAIASEISIVNESKISMEQIINTFNVATNLSKRKDKINLMKSILLTEEDRDFVLEILFGSSKLGLKIPVPDPIFGETIKVQLCGTGIEFDPSEMIIETKWDGIRCIASNNNGIITLQSRNGKVLNIPVIVKALKNILPPGTTIFQLLLKHLKIFYLPEQQLMVK